MEVKNTDRFEKMLLNVPYIADWVNYKGEDVVIMPNYEATKKANKPMVDVCYCMTKALHDSVLYTVQYDKNKFKRSRLSNINNN